MQLHLVDINSAVVDAWRSAFREFPEVSVQCNDLLAVAENTIVSPANSLGYMDGGIDAAYLEFFGEGAADLTIGDRHRAEHRRGQARRHLAAESPGSRLDARSQDRAAETLGLEPAHGEALHPARG